MISLKLKTVKFFIKDNCLYWKDTRGVLLRCVEPDESKKVMFDMHSIVFGGHHYWITNAYKMLRAGYFFPSLFFDVCVEVRACEKC